MASGSYNGIGIKVPDLLLYAGLAVGAYFVYKAVIKPTSDVTGTVGDVTSSVGGTISGGFDNLTKIENGLGNLGAGFLNNLNNAFSRIGDAGSYENKSKAGTIVQEKPIQTSGNNYVSNVSSGIVYGTPVQNITTSSGQKTTIAQTPNTFYSNLGIGFNSKGQGYSSIVPLK